MSIFRLTKLEIDNRLSELETQLALIRSAKAGALTKVQVAEVLSQYEDILNREVKSLEAQLPPKRNTLVKKEEVK